VTLDSALALLPKRKFLGRWLGKESHSVCADMERLPFAPGSFELAWSNMALHWVGEPLAAFRELERVLAPAGLVMFSTLGPDTLKELRAAAGAPRVHAFTDMHDLGDMLVAAGFSAPVIDMEMLQVEYASGRQLLDDLRASGQTNARLDRRRGLAGPRLAEEFRRRGLRATYEVVYGHAWKRAAPVTAQPAKSIRVFKSVS
jgi:malonyl-CoA O-methyltransferase